MPRNTTIPVIKLALSVSSAARALSLPATSGTALLRDEILMGRLATRQIGNRRLVPVFSSDGEVGLQEWFMSQPKSKRVSSNA